MEEGKKTLRAVIEYREEVRPSLLFFASPPRGC